MNDDPASRSKGAVGPTEVLAFWRAVGPDKWFGKHPDLDAEIAARFAATWEIAATGALAQWEETPEGALALTIVLDQLPRNMFRGQARTYAGDARARAIATRALERGFDRRISHDERQFLYLPFMHSEDLPDQLRCIELSQKAGLADSAKWAEHHADIIRRFGRFPHRNRLLGRSTTPEEQAYLDGGGFSP